MELVKPDPLIIAGQAHYTLSSYDPVVVERNDQNAIDSVTEEDVETAYRYTIMQCGGGPERMSDDAWIRDNVPGANSASELRQLIQSEMEFIAQRSLEEEYTVACVDELTKRLMQRVPSEYITRARKFVEQSFLASMQQQGMSEAAFLAGSGMSRDDLKAMFDEQARAMAEQEAALSAWIEHYGLTVSDDEIPQLLGISASEADAFMEELGKAGRLEGARHAALQRKAIESLASPEPGGKSNGKVDSKPGSKHPHLKLV